MHKVFLVSLSAALLAARLSGAAETTYGAELDRIEELVDKGNWVELRGFLQSRPDLTQGEDTFSRELQNFLGKTTSLYSALIIDQVQFPDVRNALRNAPGTALPTQTSQDPLAGKADTLLEAELAALKGVYDLSPSVGVEASTRDSDPTSETVPKLQVAQDAPENFQLAALDVDNTAPEAVTRGLTDVDENAEAGFLSDDEDGFTPDGVTAGGGAGATSNAPGIY